MRVSPRILVVVLLPGLVALTLGLPLLWTSLTSVAERGAVEHLEATLTLVVPLVEERFEEPDAELQAWVERTVFHPSLRLTLIARDGRVLADSSRSWQQVQAMDNHAGRPEVVAALKEGLGTAVRQSPTLGTDFVYVAQSLEGREGAVIVRLSEPLAALSGIRRRLARLLWAVLVVSLATFGVVTGWLNAYLFRPLATLASGADRMARGDLSQRIEVTSDESLERVGLSLNRLALRVEEQVAAVEAERSRLQVVGASMADGILVTDGEGRASTANPAFRKLFRVKGEVTGQSATELTLIPQIDDMIQATLSSRETRSQELELRIPRHRWVAVTSSLLRDASGVVVAARDITDLVQLGQTRRDLVANVSHELKTPLTAIRGYAETLASGALDDGEAAPRFVDRILQQCQRLQALLDDLLTLARLESVEGRVEFEDVDVSEVLRSTIEVLGTVAREKEVTVACSVDERLSIEADRAALDELCLNLIDNAIKYNRRGGEVSVSARGEEDHLFLEIADSGRGIPEAALPRLFERFYRVDRGRARQEGGTGLGLAIVKHAAVLHGGEIEVTSELGRGTTFKVRLPVRQSRPDRPESPPAAGAAT